MSKRDFHEGDWVIYRKQKSSASPGPRAEMLAPTTKGETYHYVVEKYWIVNQIQEDGSVQIRTRKGKRHTVEPDDPRLYKPSWWQRWLLAPRFRAVEQSGAQD